LKLARAREDRGPLSHQSKARNPPDFPEAAHATDDFSISVTAAPFLARKYAVQTPITPPPQTATRFGCGSMDDGGGGGEEQWTGVVLVFLKVCRSEERVKVVGDGSDVANMVGCRLFLLEM